MRGRGEQVGIVPVAAGVRGGVLEGWGRKHFLAVKYNYAGRTRLTHMAFLASPEQIPTPEPPKGEAEAVRERAAEISQLFREHNRALVLFLTSRLKDTQAAREVAQEAYVRVLQLEAPSAVSFLRSYLFRVALNLAVDRLRQEAVRGRPSGSEPVAEDFLDEATPERVAIATDELENLGTWVSELPQKYQEAFRLHRLEERPFEQIAEQMGIKERMARRYVANALLYLRLRREGASASDAWRNLHS